MAPTPASTFTVRHSNLDRLFPDETWLSLDPGNTASLMRDCRDDSGFGYFINVEETPPSNESITTDTTPGSKARDLFKDLAITSSGVEENSATTGISAKSARLLDELLGIVDAYLADDPGRAMLARRKLLGPKLANHILVDEGTEEVPFNWLYERRTLYLTEALVDLGQAACRWRHAEALKDSVDLPTPLPIAQDAKILILSGPRAKDSDITVSGKIAAAAAQADADYYVTLGPQIIATLESNPHCSAGDTGELVRTRPDPLRQQAPAGGVHCPSEIEKLLLQLCSQPVAAKCQHGLLVADWGRLLLPYEVRSSKTESSRAELLFATVGSYCDVRQGEPACATANHESKAGLAEPESSFRLEHLPNTVFFLLGWILQVIESLQESTSHPQEAEAEAEAKPAAAEPSDDDREEPAPPAKRARRNTKGAPPTRSSKRISETYSKSSKGAKDDTESPTHRLSLITDYVCTHGPIRGGTFAAVHECVVKRSHLEGKSVRASGQSQELNGRSAFGVLPDLGPGDCHTYLKVQRVPSMPDPNAWLPEPRFEGPDELLPSDEDRRGICERTVQEIRVFEHCEDLQGTVIPRLYGLVSPENYPRSSAHKLMLQHLCARSLGSLKPVWRHLWRHDLRYAIKAAFGQLHARRVCHGDVSSSNILVEWRKVASADSGSTSSPVSETLESWTLRGLIGDAQDQMQLDNKAFLAVARSLGERGVIDSEGNSGLALEAPASQSPLGHLRTVVKPHVWLIDFADSAIVQEGEIGDSLLASEDRKVEETLERWRK